jgi:hypothetical protein
MIEVFHYLFSPFKRPKLLFYFGYITIGTPCFLPRRTVKDPDNPGRSRFIPKKFGFDFCKLGWKTKWKDTDYRFEWRPVFSFVFFNRQFAISIVAPEEHHYWESWLFYQFHTDKNQSVFNRVQQTIKEFPQNWSSHRNGEKVEIDYYQVILKEKWRPKSQSELRDQKLKTINI